MKTVVKRILVVGVVLVSAMTVLGQTTKQDDSIVEIDPDGVARIHGKRTFVYGAYRDPSDDWRQFEGLKEAGFNLTHDYYFENSIIREGKAYGDNEIEQYIAEASEYLDLAYQNNIGVFLGVPRAVVLKADTETLKKIVQALRDKPSLWFWYLSDEPHYRKNDITKSLARCYETIRKNDGRRPVIIVDNGGFEMPLFNHCDMIWTDRYPAPFGILPVMQVQEEARKARPDKTVWSVPFAHSDLSMMSGRKYPVTDEIQRPNAKEITAMAHAALAGKAQGIIYYWYPGMNFRKNLPRTWKSLVNLGSLFKELQNVLVSPEPTVPAKIDVAWKTRYERLYEVYKTTKGPYKKERCEVVAWQRMYKGKLYVGLVNAGYQPRLRVELTIPYKFSSVIQYPGGKPVITIDKNGKWQVNQKKIPVSILNIQGKTLTLQMHECDVVVWQFDPAE